MKVVTICARNYLPYARVLGRTFMQCNPDDQFAVLLIDLLPSDPAPAEDFEVIGPWALDLADDDFARMAFMYDVTELATALKPWALQWALDGGAAVAVYLDPDIAVYESLDGVATAARSSGIAVTPHRLTPIPRDGLRPTEADIMCSGIQNLGFLAVSEDARPWLSFWQERLMTDSIVDIPNQLFTDQRWTDWIPALFSFVKLDDPGLNVAYWNLDERGLEASPGGSTCHGSPLRFFHFSGYRPSWPWCLSKYVADAPRVVISDFPALAPLLAAYDAELRTHGLYDPDKESYRYGTFSDGSQVTSWMRRRYRAALLESRQRIKTLDTPEPPAPDYRDGFSNLRAWMAEPSPQIVGLTRMAFWIWSTRADLQTAYPEPQAASRDAFGEWLQTYAVAEGYVDASWLDTVALVPSPPIPLIDVPGANLFGYFSSVLGVGAAARALKDATELAGLPTTVHTSSRSQSQRSVAVEDTKSHERYPVNIVGMNADVFIDWVDGWGRQYAPEAHTVGYWFWELEHFPKRMHRSFDHVDEVWTSSEFNAEAFRAATEKPVHVFPMHLTRAPERPWPNLPDISPDRGYFLFTFDYLSEVERKNPMGLIDAYTRAFPAQDGPDLVIKSINGHRRLLDREQVRMAAAGTPGVHLIEDYLAAEEIQALTQHALAYVSLHRSEGLGLGMMEAMAEGTPVIATAYGGNLEFMTPDTSILVPSEQVEIEKSGGYYYGLDAHWADPDLDLAAAAMRSLATEPPLAAELGARARRHIETQFTPEASAAFVRDRLETIRVERARAAEVALEAELAAQQAAAQPAALHRVYSRVLQVPVLSTAARTSVGTAKRIKRRVSQRS